MTTGRLVDAHVHVWAPDALAPDDELGPAGAIERLLEVFDTHGVERGVVVQPSVHGSDHRYLVDALAAAPERLVGVALAEPDDPGCIDVLARVAREPRIRGIRVPLIRAPRGWLAGVGESVWPIARDASCAICAFVDPSNLDDLVPWIARFRDLPVVVDHVAHVDVAGERRTDAVRALQGLARFPNVHVKVSALASLSSDAFPHRDVWSEVRAVLDAFGGERALWGSDYPPILRYGAYGESIEVARMALSDVPSETVHAVFAGNALRLFWNGDAGGDA